MTSATPRASGQHHDTDALSPVTGLDDFTARADNPLMVVTIGNHSHEKSGCLAGFVTQCSIRPPRFLVCISKVNHTYFVAERAHGIGLHLLGDDQSELASLFGEHTGDALDKFEHCDWGWGTTAAPIVSECAAWLEGVIIRRSSVGDHEALLMGPRRGGPGRHPGLLTLKNAPDFRPGHPADSRSIGD